MEAHLITGPLESSSRTICGIEGMNDPVTNTGMFEINVDLIITRSEAINQVLTWQ